MFCESSGMIFSHMFDHFVHQCMGSGWWSQIFILHFLIIELYNNVRGCWKFMLHKEKQLLVIQMIQIYIMKDWKRRIMWDFDHIHVVKQTFLSQRIPSLLRFVFAFLVNTLMTSLNWIRVSSQCFAYKKIHAQDLA